MSADASRGHPNGQLPDEEVISGSVPYLADVAIPLDRFWRFEATRTSASSLNLAISFGHKLGSAAVGLRKRSLPLLMEIEDARTRLKHDDDNQQHAEAKLNHIGGGHVKHETSVQELDRQGPDGGPDRPTSSAVNRDAANERCDRAGKKEVLQAKSLSRSRSEAEDHPTKTRAKTGEREDEYDRAPQSPARGERLLSRAADREDLAAVFRVGHEQADTDKQNDAEQARRRKVLEHARLDEIRDVEVGERDGLLLRHKERDASEKHEGSNRQDDCANSEIGDQQALKDADQRRDRQREHERVECAERIRKSDHDDRGEGRIRSDRKIDLPRDDAQGETESDRTEDREALQNGEGRIVGCEQPVRQCEIDIDACSQKHRKAEIGIVGDPGPSPPLRRPGAHSTDLLPRRASANTAILTTIISPTDRILGPLVYPLRTIILSTTAMKIAPKLVRRVEPKPPVIAFPPTITVAMTDIVMSPDDPNSDEK